MPHLFIMPPGKNFWNWWHRSVHFFHFAFHFSIVPIKAPPDIKLNIMYIFLLPVQCIPPLNPTYNPLRSRKTHESWQCMSILNEVLWIYKNYNKQRNVCFFHEIWFLLPPACCFVRAKLHRTYYTPQFGAHLVVLPPFMSPATHCLLHGACSNNFKPSVLSWMRSTTPSLTITGLPAKKQGFIRSSRQYKNFNIYSKFDLYKTDWRFLSA